MLPEDQRPMHLAVIGLSGVGKSYFLENLMRQDIEQGTGFVLFDVHGDLADNIVAFIAEHTARKPKDMNRLILIEPFDETCSVGFNPLERTPHTSAYLQSQEMAKILRTRWETHTFGPRTEELLRNSLYVLSHRDLTLLELPLLLTDPEFRNDLLQQVHDPAVLDYWKARYNPFSEPLKAVIREPLLSRIATFLADPHIRDLVGQRKSTFSFHRAIAESLWVVVNLAKGRLGDENAAVLGSLLFTKLELDVMAQAQIPQHQRTLFAVYADELQNLAGNNIATLIAEARKYGVSLTAGHQYWAQLPPDLRSAMLAVGSRVLFRLHYHDATQLAGEIDPREKPWATARLTQLPRGRAIFRSGPHQPVEFRVNPHAPANPSAQQTFLLKQSSRSRHATARTLIERDIHGRRNQIDQRHITQLIQSRKLLPSAFLVPQDPNS